MQYFVSIMKLYLLAKNTFVQLLVHSVALGISLILGLMASSKAFAFDMNQPVSAADLWHQSALLAGPPEAIGQRSLMFHKIYLDSHRQMPFALSVSHLTLAIERSIDFGTLDELSGIIPYSKSIKEDMRLWRQSLQKMNRDMFRRTWFAWMYSKHIYLFGAPPVSTPKEQSLINSISPILNVMLDIHQKKKIGLPLKLIKFYTQLLITWEHTSLFQPQLEQVFEHLHGIMKWNLKMTPGERLEKNLLEPLFNLRSTLNLQCFQDPNKKLRTSNFMDPSQRIQQALSFFQELSQLSYDPALFCYNDEYYLSHFPADFFEQTNIYLNKLADDLLSGQISQVNLSDKVTTLKNSFPSKLSPIRVFQSLRSQNACTINNLDFWKFYFSNLLDFPKSLLKTQISGGGKRLAHMEMGVARNTLINQAYTTLFLLHSQSPESKSSDAIPYSWLGSAAFGSASIGKQMLYGMYIKLKNNFPEEILSQFSKQDLKAVHSYMTNYSSWFAKLYGFQKTLAHANQAVFHDIFWQFFVSQMCGTQKTIDLLEKSNSATDQQSLIAWKSISRNDLITGNLQLLRVEQELVLQPAMYDSFLSRYFSIRGIFNEYAQPGAPGPNGPLLGFTDFVHLHKLPENLSKLDVRMAWVNYLVTNHAIYFQKKNNNEELNEVFSDIIRVYEKILNYYTSPS